MTNKNEIKVVTAAEVPFGSARVIGQHKTLAAAQAKARKNVTGTFIIHEPETACTNERFLVALPAL